MHMCALCYKNENRRLVGVCGIFISLFVVSTVFSNAPALTGNLDENDKEVGKMEFRET